MNILITVSDKVWGGKHTYMYRAARALREAGHQIWFCCEGGSDLHLRLAREETTPILVPDFSAAREVAVESLAAALVDHSIDIAIATGRRDYLASWLAICAARRAVTFVLVRLSGFPIDLSPPYVEVFRNADAILLLTDRIVAQQFQPLIDDGTLTMSCFAEFRTTVDTVRFTPRPPDRAIRRELGIADGERVIASVARLSWEKDHPTILHAFAEARRSLGGLKLLLVGEGEMRETIEALAGSLGIASDVIMTGQREDLPELLSVCDVHVLASICEETGAISLQEGMAMGVPVVASRIGVIPDYVRHDETGLLFTPADAGELAGALLRLLTTPALAERLARSGRDEIVTRFDEAAQMRRLNRFLEDLARRPPRAAAHRTG